MGEHSPGSGSFGGSAVQPRCAPGEAGSGAPSDAEEVRHVYRKRQDEAQTIIQRFIRLGSSAGKLHAGDDEVLAKATLVLLQGLQNPLVLQPGSGPVVDEVTGAVFRLLSLR